MVIANKVVLTERHVLEPPCQVLKGNLSCPYDVVSVVIVGLFPMVILIATMVHEYRI